MMTLKGLPTILVSVFAASAVFLVTIAGCGTRPAPVTEGTASRPAVKPTAIEQAAWEEKWGRILRAAKEEGSVRIYDTMTPDARTKIAKAFKEKFDINVEYVSGSPADLSQKVLSERRAGLYLADVFVSGGALLIAMLKPNGVLDSIEPVLVLPETVDPKLWTNGQIPFYDREGTCIGFAASLSRFVLRNTDMVGSNEISSYRDLLKPKWKGKMVLEDPNLGRTALYWITMLSEEAWSREEARSYLAELKKQDVSVINDPRLVVEWVAKGKYPLGIAANPPTGLELISAGAPIAFEKVVEGSMMSTGTAGVGLANKAAHPNAAAVFINWLLTREGQTTSARAIDRPSRRLDVSKEGFDPILFPDSGEKTFAEDENFILSTPKVLAMFNEVFRH